MEKTSTPSSIPLAGMEAGVSERDLVGCWVALLMRLHDVDRIIVEETRASEPTVVRFGVHIDRNTTVDDLADQIDGKSTHADVELDDPTLVTIGLRQGAISEPSTASHADTVLCLGANPDHATISVDGTTVDSAEGRELGDRLATFIGDHLADPGRPIATLPLAGAQESQRIEQWNDTAVEHDATRSLIALFDEQLAVTPDAFAVVVDGSPTTYQELSASADRLVAVLDEHGVVPGDAVALCVDRSVGLASGMLGILRAGAAYVPIDPAYPRERQSYMIADCGAAAIVTDSANAVRLRSEFSGTVVNVDELGGHIHGTTPVAPDRRGASGADPGYIIYTSGSTGTPKGVRMPQRALTNLVEWQRRRPQAVPVPRTLQFSALSFDVSFQEIFSTWAAGGTLVLISEDARRSSDSLLDSLITNDIERLFLPFVALRALAQTAVRTDRFPTTLREVYTAGEQLRVDETVRAFFARLPQCVLENQYGPSETHVCTAYTLGPDPDDWSTLPPIGSPIANSSAHVLDRWGHARPVGWPGELAVTGVCVADGYLGQPDMSAKRFVELPTEHGAARAYLTGDIVRWRSDGDLEFVGRRDTQTKVRGYRVEPGEVAAVLSAAPGVSECLAVVRDDLGSETARLVGYIVAADRSDFRLDRVRDFLADRLPEYMVPTHWAILDEFPVTPSGKLDTQSLPAPAFEREILSSEYAAPKGAFQEELASLWQELLGVQAVGVDDDFFELGGDSLLAVEMTTRMFERLDVDMPLGALAGARTISQLDDLFSRETTTIWRPLVPVRSTGTKLPYFVVHGGSGNVASFGLLADALPRDQPLYALQWNGLDGGRGARTIEDMARCYVDEIRSVQPEGPYRLGGQCVGGLVAHEMAGQLRDADEQVDLVVMYDSPNLASTAYVRRQMPFFISQLKRTMASGSQRRQRIETGLRSLLRLSVPVTAREVHGTLAMIRASWRHRPRVDAVAAHTIFIGSGLSNASDIALAGSWTDGLMGWSDRAGDGFDTHLVEAAHNDVPYHPTSVEIVMQALTD